MEQFQHPSTSPPREPAPLMVVDGIDTTPNLMTFRQQFQGTMAMAANRVTVMNYLDNHAEWFHRCAEPMTVSPIGKTGYALSLGRYGALGFYLEPKIGLDLLPQDQGVYRIATIPVPHYHFHGYDVDFQARLLMKQASPLAMETEVIWDLDLMVQIQFPKFIQVLPHNLIQRTGDRLLRQIVQQVSRRLTAKVQQDFHQSLGLALPHGCS